MRGIHGSLVNSPQKGQWGGALMFSMICAWINDWVNNRYAGDLRRHRAHYDFTVMESTVWDEVDAATEPVWPVVFDMLITMFAESIKVHIVSIEIIDECRLRNVHKADTSLDRKSHESCEVSNHRKFYCWFNNLHRLTTTKMSTFSIIGLFGGNAQVTGGCVCYAENVFICYKYWCNKNTGVS